jgi:hypothetical protein
MPTKVNITNYLSILQVVTSSEHSCFLAKNLNNLNNEMYCWGYNGFVI